MIVRNICALLVVGGIGLCGVLPASALIDKNGAHWTDVPILFAGVTWDMHSDAVRVQLEKEGFHFKSRSLQTVSQEPLDEYTGSLNNVRISLFQARFTRSEELKGIAIYIYPAETDLTTFYNTLTTALQLKYGAPLSFGQAGMEWKSNLDGSQLEIYDYDKSYVELLYSATTARLNLYDTEPANALTVPDQDKL